MGKIKKKKFKKGHYAGIAIAAIIISAFAIAFSNIQSLKENSKPVYNVQAAAQIVWQQFDGNAQKSANNTTDPINATNAKSLQKSWQVPISSDGSPVFLSGVTTSQGIKSLVYVTTESGGLIAFDEATGKQIWSATTQGSSGTVTSSPAIDPNSQFIYNYGKDGKVHKYDVGTGKEETSGGWPLLITVIPNIEKGSSALAIASGNLYMATSAYPGDGGQYVGHIVAKNLTSGTVSIFNTLCANTTQILNGTCASRNSGVWSRPGIVQNPNSGNIFVATGNGPYAPPNNLADSVIELTPNFSKIVDTYTPTNFQQLQDGDADLGSTDIVIIPSLNIGVQGGKDDKLRVLNIKNLSGKGGPGHTGGELQTVSVSCNIFSQPISWVDSSKNVWVFVTDMCKNLYGYKVVNNTLQKVYQNTSGGGSSPLMVNNTLFIESSGSVKAINPTSGAILWTGAIGNMHWQSPAVADGHLFVIDSSNLTSFTIPNNPVNTTPQPGAPTSFACLGSCPTPSSRPSSESPSTTIPSGDMSPNPSTTFSPPSVSINPTQPCTTTQSVTHAQKSSSTKILTKQHPVTKPGLLQLLLQFILQLLQLLFQQLGVPVSVITNPCSPSSSSPAPVNQSNPTSIPSVQTPATTPTSGGIPKTPVSSSTATCPNVVDPAYFYPPSYWPQLLSGKATPASVGFIFNPASGPGSNVDQNLLSEVQKAKAAGEPIYAYVDTGYGNKSASSVEAQINSYKSMYGITDIMFDEMSSNASELSYYQTLINYVHSSTTGAKVILNPGTYPAQSYMSLDATFTVFEGPYTSFVNDSVPSWVGSVTANKQSVVVYATSATNLTNALKLAEQRNAGTVYITDNANSGNPYNTLPAYWSTELSQIASSCSK